MIEDNDIVLVGWRDGKISAWSIIDNTDDLFGDIHDFFTEMENSGRAVTIQRGYTIKE